jgi:hypothetical protein
MVNCKRKLYPGEGNDYLPKNYVPVKEIITSQQKWFPFKQDDSLSK